MAQILQSLNKEWSAIADSPEARRALMRWSAAHPVLMPANDLDDVIALGYDIENGPEIRRALALLASTDPLAARTLLQELVGGLCNLARRIGRDQDAIDDILSLTWERIRTYPAHRLGSVSGNVLLDVRKRYEMQFGRERPCQPCDLPAEPRAASVEDQALGDVSLEELVASARRAGVADDVLNTIIRSRVLGEPMKGLAAEQNVSRKVLWHRRWRGEARIRMHLSAA